MNRHSQPSYCWRDPFPTPPKASAARSRGAHCGAYAPRRYPRCARQPYPPAPGDWADRRLSHMTEVRCRGGAIVGHAARALRPTPSRRSWIPNYCGVGASAMGETLEICDRRTEECLQCCAACAGVGTLHAVRPPATRPRIWCVRRPGVSFSGRTRHQLLACDCFTVETLFLQTPYALFFPEVGTRRVQRAGCTARPAAAWATRQARQLASALQEGVPPVHSPIHDRECQVLADLCYSLPSGERGGHPDAVPRPPRKCPCGALGPLGARGTPGPLAHRLRGTPAACVHGLHRLR